MSALSDFGDMCPDVICWQSLTSRDQYGKPSYGDVVTFVGQRDYHISRVASYERGTKGQGAEVISQSTIIILDTPAIKYEDRIFVAGDDVDNVPPILAVEIVEDEAGPYYLEVTMGSSNG